MYIVLFVILILSGCSIKSEDGKTKIAIGADVSELKPKDIVKVGDCSTDPKLSNEEIITLNNQCVAAFMDAEALHCGDDARITHIQCLPKNKQ